MTNLRRIATNCLVVLPVAGAILAGCHTPPLLAPTGTVITLVSQTNVLAVNGSTDLTAVLIEQGIQGGAQPGTGTGAAGTGQVVHDGTEVTFTTTLGRIDPSVAKTTGGKAIVKLYADGKSGTATITAFSGAATKTLTVLVGAAAASRIIVTANPQSMPSTGGLATIMARIEDQQGNGLEGVPISFSTSAGNLASTNVLSGPDGVAATTLTTTKAATVTASAGGSGTATLQGTVAITLRDKTVLTISPPASAVISSAASFTIGVGSTTDVREAVIDFGDGSKVPLGNISGTMTVVHMYRGGGGTYDVTLTAKDADGPVGPITTQVVVLNVLVTAATGSPSSGVFGTVHTYSVSLSSSAASVDHYEFVFGDGEVKTSNAATTTHIYNQRGSYEFVIKVYLTSGDVRTGNGTINVQ